MTYTNKTKKTWDLIFSMYEVQANEKPLYIVKSIKEEFGLSSDTAYKILNELQSRGVIYSKKAGREINYGLTEDAIKMVEMFQESPELFKMTKTLGVYPFGRDIPERKKKTLAQPI